MAFFHACITSLDIENSLSIFSCHVAGNVENFDILGSMEFARKISGAKAILVMGIRGAARLKALSTTPNSAISRACWQKLSQQWQRRPTPAKGHRRIMRLLMLPVDMDFDDLVRC